MDLTLTIEPLYDVTIGSPVLQRNLAGPSPATSSGQTDPEIRLDATPRARFGDAEPEVVGPHGPRSTISLTPTTEVALANGLARARGPLVRTGDP